MTTSCDKIELNKRNEIPEVLEKDLLKRYPFSKIIDLCDRQDGLTQIDFIDQEQNKASIWYAGEEWKMTYTKIARIDQLSFEAQHTFKNSAYRNVQISDIYKTERKGIEKDLYRLHFRYRWKKYDNVEHYVFINEDGMFLTTLMSIPNNPIYFINLSEDHFDFIREKYSGAEVRGYVNNFGYHEYFILHEGIVKYVFFGSENVKDFGFWKKTMYELSIDTKIPDNVLKELKRNDPDFIYTNVYYIESEGGNAYLLKNMNDENELGYCIGENIGRS